MLYRAAAIPLHPASGSAMLLLTGALETPHRTGQTHGFFVPLRSLPGAWPIQDPSGDNYAMSKMR